MADDVDEVVEGRRVICDGQYGTVKFFGTVPPATGLWYGIEWDDDGRGKHSGEHEGVKYFECSRPGSGSFARASKLEFGVSYVEALMSKFNDLHHREETEDLEFFYCIGEEKLQGVEDKLKQLKHANLRLTNLSKAGNEKSLGNITPNIVELDLSKTLLSDWREVLKIVEVLPQLTKLDVSETRLNVSKRPDVDGHPAGDVKLPLKTLVVNKTNMDWQQVLAISSSFGNLEELYVCFNKIQHLKGGDLKHLAKLRKLNLEGNDLSDWNDILSLQVLTFLESLVLNDTKLNIVSFPGDVSEASDVFSNLKSLSLSKTMISNWSSINQMNRLLSLRKLTFKRCPLVKDIPEYEARQDVIARLAKSSKLNQSDVTVKERQAAERAYLKKYGKEWLAAGGSRENLEGKVDVGFKVKQPRYLSLLKTHDVPEVLGAMTSLGSALKDNLVVVTIACVNDPEKKPVIKKLPRTLTISKLKGMMQRLFKVPSVRQMLSYVDQTGREIEMDDDLRPLSFYSLESGDTINVRW